MTLTDVEETACSKRMQPTVQTELSPPDSSGSGMGVALREALWQAMDQGRLKTGVVECATLLEKDPYSVMMCVMPVAGPDDVTAIIQRTLIEAFCHEYHIRLIKVDSVSKLDKVLAGRTLPPDPPQTQTPPPKPEPRAPSPADVICVLVLCPGGGEGGTGERKEEEGGEGVAHLQKVMACGNADKFIGTVPLPDD